MSKFTFWYPQMYFDQINIFQENPSSHNKIFTLSKTWSFVCVDCLLFFCVSFLLNSGNISDYLNDKFLPSFMVPTIVMQCIIVSHIIPFHVSSKNKYSMADPSFWLMLCSRNSFIMGILKVTTYCTPVIGVNQPPNRQLKYSVGIIHAPFCCIPRALCHCAFDPYQQWLMLCRGIRERNDDTNTPSSSSYNPKNFFPQ